MSTPTRNERRKMAGRLGGRHRERRVFAGSTLEIREVGGALHLTGYASVTGHAYDMGWYTETIRSGAFRDTLARRPDVQLLVNHEGLPLARTVSGSLRLAEDSRGLHVDADLDPSDIDVQRLAPKVARGLIDQMSFAFGGAKSEWNENYDQRTIIALDIHRGDVSCVNQGANDATSFAVGAGAGSLSRSAGRPRRLWWYEAQAEAMRLRGNGARRRKGR